MEESLDSKVLAKVDEIVSYIKNSNNYKKYKIVEERIQNNHDIMDKINKIKKIQKEIVKMEIKHEDITKKEEEITNILSVLNSYPIYQEYSYLLDDLNDTFQQIKTIIESYLNDKLN